MNSLKKSRFWSRLSLPHAFTMLFFILIFLGVISWIMSWAGVTYTTADGEVKIIGAGILDWFSTLPAGFVNSFFIILFVFVLGGFVNVVVKSQALEAMVGKIASKFRSGYKEVPIEIKRKSFLKYYWLTFREGFVQTWVIIPLMLFFSFAGTTYGLAEESLAFYAIIIPLALAAGFDVWTGFLIIFVGAGAGVMGSTINPFSILAANAATTDAVGKSNIDLSSTGVAWRWVGWVLFTFISIAFVMVYGAKVKRNKEKSALKDLFAVHEKTFQSAAVGTVAPPLTRRRVITFALFMFSFVFMVFAMLNYDSMASVKGEPMTKFESNVFGNKLASSWIHNSKFTENLDSSDNNVKYMGDGYVYSWIFGYWYFGALISFFFIISLITAFINRTGEKRYINDMLDGAKDMIAVGFAIGIARAISVLLDNTKMNGYFVKHLSDAIGKSEGNKNITIPLLSYIFFIPLTFLIPSTSGLANASFPILGPAIHEAHPSAVSGTITAYGWGAGFANMFVPTYGVVIGALAITKIPFGKFLKAISKYLLLMFFVGFFMIIIGGAIGGNTF